MKKWSLGIVATLIGLIILSCSKDELDTYNSNNSIYYTQAFNGKGDSLNITFASKPIDVKSLLCNVEVSVQGDLSNVDREISVKIRPESTAKKGVHFDMPEKILFRANTATDTIPITFYRTSDMLTDEITLVLELIPNEYFKVDMKDKILNSSQKVLSYTVMKISVNDILGIPEYWEENYLGVYTSKKMALMSQLLDLPLDYYNNPDISYSVIEYQGVFMQRYLDEQDEIGNTIYEEDGTIMKMGRWVNNI